MVEEVKMVKKKVLIDIGKSLCFSPGRKCLKDGIGKGANSKVIRFTTI